MSITETTRQTNDDEMTDEQCGAFDFEPWAHRPDEWQPPTNEQWHKMALTYLPTVRIAWLMLFKTKAELMEMVEQMGKDDEFTDRFFDDLEVVGYFFKSTHEILYITSARLVRAGSAVIVRDKAGNDLEGEARA